jgi:hypothetical protein
MLLIGCSTGATLKTNIMFYFELNDILEATKNSFYKTATYKRGRQKIGTLIYLSKPINEQQKEQIAKLAKVEFMQSRSQFAPELQASVILKLSKAEINRTKK